MVVENSLFGKIEMFPGWVLGTIYDAAGELLEMRADYKIENFVAAVAGWMVALWGQTGMWERWVCDAVAFLDWPFCPCPCFPGGLNSSRLTLSLVFNLFRQFRILTNVDHPIDLRGEPIMGDLAIEQAFLAAKEYRHGRTHHVE